MINSETIRKIGKTVDNKILFYINEIVPLGQDIRSWIVLLNYTIIESGISLYVMVNKISNLWEITVYFYFSDFITNCGRKSPFGISL